jgi:hypothetical protein
MSRTAVRETAEIGPEIAEAPTCAHHWVIAPPNGATSPGRCKVCGMEKEFPNSAEDGLWERDVPQSRWTGRADSNSYTDGF